MGQITGRAVAAGKRAHAQWVTIQYRWWYIAGAAVLSLIFEGPRNWIATRVANVNAALSLPDHLWGKWLIVALGFGLILWGARQSGRGDKMRRTELMDVVKDHDMLPMLVAAYHVQRSEEARERAIVEKATQLVDGYRGILANLAQGEEALHRGQHRHALNQMCQDARSAVLELRTLDPNLPDWDFQPRDPVPDIEFVQQYCESRFDKDNPQNRVFLQEHSANVEALAKGMAGIENATLVPRWRAIQHAAERVEIEARNYAARR